jgi:hypothetical protein
LPFTGAAQIRWVAVVGALLLTAGIMTTYAGRRRLTHAVCAQDNDE